jgi:hypothetical protein
LIEPTQTLLAVAAAAITEDAFVDLLRAHTHKKQQ